MADKRGTAPGVRGCREPMSAHFRCNKGGATQLVWDSRAHAQRAPTTQLHEASLVASGPG